MILAVDEVEQVLWCIRGMHEALKALSESRMRVLVNKMLCFLPVPDVHVSSNTPLLIYKMLLPYFYCTNSSCPISLLKLPNASAWFTRLFSTSLLYTPPSNLLSILQCVSLGSQDPAPLLVLTLDLPSNTM